VNFLSLTLIDPEVRAGDWVSFVVWLVCAALGSRLLDRYLPGRDPFLFPLTMFLSGWGLVVIDRLAPPFADRQTLWLVISTGALLMVALSPHPLRWLRNFRYVLLVIGLALLIGTIILGTNPSGVEGAPEHWLGFAGVYFQPSEALKIILVAFLASYLGEQYPALRAAGPTETHRRFAVTPQVALPDSPHVGAFREYPDLAARPGDCRAVLCRISGIALCRHRLHTYPGKRCCAHHPRQLRRLSPVQRSAVAHRHLVESLA
jgi:hypothetical protein